MTPRVQQDTVDETLSNLIEQFSDVFCFYRELIQNSLDAGTNRVDVYLEYIPPEKESKSGVIKIHVDDYGEGMNREIIDGQLTRLFSSSKENDLTKIGKFGIGFVSVFAIKPDAVIIDTSRDGEDWRIIFNADKKFERFKRDYPVDGTKITILKSGNEKFYKHFLEKSKETVVFWCKHSEAEIYYQNELINEPFDIKSEKKIVKKSETAEIVAAYTTDANPFFGFYNQGLTLLEGKKEFFPQTAFKIKSKHIEHTMTRDNVREDESYWKAMEALNNIVKNELPESLFDEIEKELMSSGPDSKRYESLLKYIGKYYLSMKDFPNNCRHKAIALDHSGRGITAVQLYALKTQSEVYWDENPNVIAETFTREGKRVIKTKEGSLLLSIINSLRIVHPKTKSKEKSSLLRVSKHFYKPEIINNSDLSDIQKKLLYYVDDINRKMGIKTGPCCFANFHYPESCITKRIYVMQEKPGEISPIKEIEIKESGSKSLFSLFARTRTLVLNHKHSYIKNIVKLGNTHPEMAAYFLAKLLYMDDGVHTDVDTKLASIALNMAGAAL